MLWHIEATRVIFYPNCLRKLYSSPVILSELFRGFLRKSTKDGNYTMDEAQKKAQSKEFYTLADKFIDIANDECEEQDPSFVGSTMLFATARFSAFVVASQAQDKDSYEAELERATEFFTDEFDRMLKQNMEDYKTAFTQQDEARYEHLMKKD